MRLSHLGQADFAHKGAQSVLLLRRQGGAHGRGSLKGKRLAHPNILQARATSAAPADEPQERLDLVSLNFPCSAYEFGADAPLLADHIGHLLARNAKPFQGCANLLLVHPPDNAVFAQHLRVRLTHSQCAIIVPKSHTHERAMTSVIEKFGGVRPMAAKLNVPPSTVKS